MANMIARILIGADDHVSSRNYGGHVDYPAESLHYFKLKTDLLEQFQCTHMIGTGDLSYGRITSLEYRKEINKQLARQKELTHGNRWEVKGNHDSSTAGMTEYEYYVSEGLIRPSENLQIGPLNISMVDSGALKGINKPGIPIGQRISTQIIPPDPNRINLVVAHDYIMAKDVNVPPMGDYYSLESITEWYGIDYLICGHIHIPMVFRGSILSQSGAESHEVLVQYPGCLPRPNYMGERTPSKCQVVIITVFDDDTIEYASHDIDLWPLEQSYDLARMKKEAEVKELKHVDVSDVVERLANHTNTIGNPEDKIMAMCDIPEEYRAKAIELLKQA